MFMAVRLSVVVLVSLLICRVEAARPNIVFILADDLGAP